MKHSQVLWAAQARILTVELSDLATINTGHAVIFVFQIISEYVFSINMPQIVHGYPVCYLATLFTKLFYLSVPLFPDGDDTN